MNKSVCKLISGNCDLVETVNCLIIFFFLPKNYFYWFYTFSPRVITFSSHKLHPVDSTYSLTLFDNQLYFDLTKQFLLNSNFKKSICISHPKPNYVTTPPYSKSTSSMVAGSRGSFTNVISSIHLLISPPKWYISWQAHHISK